MAQTMQNVDWEVSPCSSGSRLHNGVVAGLHTEIGSISMWMTMMVR